MTQYARPDSDIAVDPGWSSYPSGDLYTCVDEETPSDSDYITGSVVGDNCSLGLSEVDDPGIHTGHTLRWRWRAVDASPQPETANILLRQTSYPTVWNSGELTVPRTWTTEYHDLTTAEAAAIVAYNILYVQTGVVQLQTNEEVQISWIVLEVPDVPAAGGASNLMLLGVG